MTWGDGVREGTTTKMPKGERGRPGRGGGRRRGRCEPAAALIAAALIAAGCGTHRPTQPIQRIVSPDAMTTVRPGDVIDIEFWRQPEISGSRIVDRDGRIQMPLVHGVEVAGLSAEQIRSRLTELYDRFYDDPLIVVNVKLGVNVTGAVQTPGRYTVDPALTLFDVLGLAGGLQHDGDRQSIELVRESERYRVDLDDALVATEPGAFRLQSGDWIYVPRRFWTLQRVATYATISVLVLQVIDFATR